MDITFHETIKNNLIGFKIAYAVLKDVKVEKSNQELLNEIRSVIDIVKDKYSNRSEVYESIYVKVMRDIFKSNKIDPSKYPPSAESLLKRIIDGKGLYYINNIVDCNNLGSIRYELPMGVYNLANIQGNIEFKIGEKDDVMETMAKGNMSMENILVSKDDSKLFGSPVSDSIYAKIDDKVNNVLLIIYGSALTTREYLNNAVEYVTFCMQKFSGARVVEKGVVDF
jgi:DNA/RNA-binding domain of Phe-tRNA-synthetase-like protein